MTTCVATWRVQIYILGDPEVTATLYCNFVPVLGRLRDLEYIFAVTSDSPSTYYIVRTWVDRIGST